MALMAMLFALVFVTELIAWIGQSVLLEFVRIPPLMWLRVFDVTGSRGSFVLLTLS